MSISRRSRIFIGIFVVYLGAVALLLYRIATDIDPRYREAAEEALVDTAQLLATLLERRAFDGVIPTDELERTMRHLAERPVYARIFDIEKTRVNLHVYVTDRNGIVLYDSRGRGLGKDYSGWRDVRLTLQGSYGARTTLDEADDVSTAIMYVGAPIRERGPNVNIEAGQDIIGMVGVGKPIEAITPFIANAREKLIQVGVVSALGFAAALLAAIIWLVRPFGLMADLWRTVRRDRRQGAAAPLAFGRRLVHALRTAFAEARDAVAGRSYVDQYVQTLTHEMKTPLAAIRGAAELLREPMSEANRVRFTANIEEQVARAQDIVDRMLELTTLERRGALGATERIDVAHLMSAVVAEATPLAEKKRMRFELDAPQGLFVQGDAFLLARALSNLVRNAIDFAPEHSTVELGARQAGRNVQFSVHDYGPGLPAYAQQRVFEKFFSTPRPGTEKKGTGLGLAFVKEVAALHGGAVRLGNHAEGGAVAVLELPLAQR